MSNDPKSSVVQIASRQTAIPSFPELEREGEAQAAASEIMEAPDADLESVDGRAHAINGALSTLDFVAITGREYWSVFGNSPATPTYESWVRSAHAKLTDIVREADKAHEGT